VQVRDPFSHVRHATQTSRFFATCVTTAHMDFLVGFRRSISKFTLGVPGTAQS
jgi:hypothetical protein